MENWALGYLFLGVVVSLFVLRITKYNLREGKPLAGTALERILYPDGKPLGLRIQERLVDWLVPVFVFLTVMAAWPAFLSAAAYGRLKANHAHETEPKDESPNKFYARANNLIAQTTVQVVEARERIIDPLEAVPPIPFGHLNGAWCSLKAAMQPGDELWSFGPVSGETKHNWSAARGYAIRRDGRIIAEVVVESG